MTRVFGYLCIAAPVALVLYLAWGGAVVWLGIMVLAIAIACLAAWGWLFVKFFTDGLNNGQR